MKKNIVYILIAMSFFAMSCIKDMTNMDVKPVAQIVIDTTGMGLTTSYTTFQGDSLKIKIKVNKTGTSNDNLKYEWGINTYGGYKRIVGVGRNLETKITEAPGSFVLIYTVTDTTTNQKAFFTWNLAVNSAYGSGLIVVDTRDDINSDYNLIMGFNFTPGMGDSESKIFRNLYSGANSKKIEGIVKDVSYERYTTSRFLTSITDKSIIRVDPLSYQFTMRDNQCFLLPPEKISPNKIQSTQQTNPHEYIVNDGKVHYRYTSTAPFGYRFLGDNLDYSCKEICGLQLPTSSTAAAVLYDEKNNRFLLTPTITSSSGTLTSFPAVDNSGVAPAFDPRNMGNKTCLHLEEGQNKRVLAIMKSRDAAQYFVYQVLLAPLNGKMGYSLHDITNNPEINNSKYYTCSQSENVLFYATDNKVYATTLLAGGGTDASLRYTVESGEKITGMRMHIMQGNINLPSLVNPLDFTQRQTMPAANRMLILSTYNEATKNGKIITIPLQTLGVGGLVTDPLYIKTYSGFGRITAFCNQNQ
ncbi:PKD-like family lipoprotein [Solitalea koreensis]|uniref:PKD-like family protein n=1 Tax=Solitalea koreensis TaxID=543615 RepID=A0A521AFS2_9SPHI|nr:PKD-like family lipoprotein [Solitalea koreensis]SMO33655.1 PKD-like family protein [Solitalea koreensis]